MHVCVDIIANRRKHNESAEVFGGYVSEISKSIEKLVDSVSESDTGTSEVQIVKEELSKTNLTLAEEGDK